MSAGGSYRAWARFEAPRILDSKNLLVVDADALRAYLLHRVHGIGCDFVGMFEVGDDCDLPFSRFMELGQDVDMLIGPALR